MHNKMQKNRSRTRARNPCARSRRAAIRQMESRVGWTRNLPLRLSLEFGICAEVPRSLRQSACLVSISTCTSLCCVDGGFGQNAHCFGAGGPVPWAMRRILAHCRTTCYKYRLPVATGWHTRTGNASRSRVSSPYEKQMRRSRTTVTVIMPRAEIMGRRKFTP